ncbi:MaoC family dehydratase [Athalassotoga saccharophila]|uniref:MaoC family dehydratase n=1 Tax=Athalassotoga saccharophila TaxID=1441386 RepID=UPI001379B2DE|nr:MaoC family dehydratase [Athalassotoga saccharophila]BBJ27314.1 (R)-specific enoyl-CoA hydratase [Athalassotoga saccharophila]
MNFEKIEIGQNFESDMIITDEMVKEFARITGDNNPLHLDEEFAKKTQFGRRIAHGMLIASLISKVLGRDFPGPGTVYVSQFIQFRKPVYIGETVKIKIEVKDKKIEKKRLILNTTVMVKDRIVITGEAEVYLPDQ